MNRFSLRQQGEGNEENSRKMGSGNWYFNWFWAVSMCKTYSRERCNIRYTVGLQALNPQQNLLQNNRNPLHRW